MEDQQASLTALMTAYCRAYHAVNVSPKIFDDFLADRMFTNEERITFNRLLSERLPLVNPALAATKPDQATALTHIMQAYGVTSSLSRARYTENCLEQAVTQGTQQYILLGAGLDTFAFRRPDLVSKLQVFEIDHPATQALKQRRLAALKMATPTQLNFVAVDFAKQNLEDGLRNSTYDTQKVGFFSWLGVVCYLTRDAVFNTLQSIARLAPKGSTIVFDYLDRDAFIPAKSSRAMQMMQASTRAAGEPMKTGFNPLTLDDELKTVGFSLEENLSPQDIQDRYFQDRTDEYHAFEHIHFARAVIA